MTKDPCQSIVLIDFFPYSGSTGIFGFDSNQNRSEDGDRGRESCCTFNKLSLTDLMESRLPFRIVYVISFSEGSGFP